MLNARRGEVWLRTSQKEVNPRAESRRPQRKDKQGLFDMSDSSCLGIGHIPISHIHLCALRDLCARKSQEWARPPQAHH